jgi:uncharacterized membrane protein
MSPHGRIAGNASAVLGFIQFGVSALGGLVVSAVQNAQVTPTAVPMAATIAVCGSLALCINLLTRSTAVRPSECDEAEGSIIAAEH